MENNYKKAKEEITKKYQKLIEFEESGIIPTPNFLTIFHDIIYDQSNRGDAISELLYGFHSFLVEKAINESFNVIKNVLVYDFLNSFIRQINKIMYILFYLNKGFYYLEKNYIRIYSLYSLNKNSFNLFKSHFLIPCQNILSKSLIYYFFENNNIDKAHISLKIKKILDLIKTIDKISIPKIVKRNTEFEWENERDNQSEDNDKIFDNWFNTYFLKDIDLYYKKKSKEFKELPIKKIIQSILNIKYDPIIFKDYFDEGYYNKILFIFNENFMNNDINTGMMNGEKLVWVDRNANNNENKKYKILLRYMGFKLYIFEYENEGINQIKRFKFEKISLFISGFLFENFIHLFKNEKAKISCTFNMIVFTTIINESYIKEICSNDNDISNGLLFKKENIFYEIKDFLFSLCKNENEKEQIFEKIESMEQMLPHIYYPELIKPITKEEIFIFNQYLLINYHQEEKMKELIGQLVDNPEMPNEIICKYWARAFTLETNFYGDMRHKLQTKKGKFFCPFIKMMYEGIKIKALTPKIDSRVFRGSIISYSELNFLEQNLQNENMFPKLIVYFRGFHSYSLDRGEALRFMNRAPPPDEHIKALFIIQSFNIDNIPLNLMNQEIENGNINSDLIKLLSNANLKNISQFPDEEEILFFPLSCFEVKNINKNFRDHVEITLEYLGKYRQNININPQSILPLFQTSEFGREILDLELINYKEKYSWKIVKEIFIDKGDVNCILYLKDNLILFSINNLIRVYNIIKNQLFLRANIHRDTINDILKIDNKKFISSSKDNTIKYFKLSDNYLNYEIIKAIEVHRNEVNQTIKLQMDNYYASCSNDKNICIWSFEENSNRFRPNLTLRGHESKVITIFELQNNSIVSASKAGFLKFWEKDLCIKSLEIGDIPLNHGFYWHSENFIMLGTNRSIIFVDIIKKEIAFTIPLNFTSSSICNFFGNVIFGLINNNYPYLREFEISKNRNSFELVAEGKDYNTLEISCIQILDDKTIITANKEKHLKIWKKGNIEMPKLIKCYSSKKEIYTLQKEEKKNIYFDNELELKKKEKIKEEENYNLMEIKLNSIKYKEQELIVKEMNLKEKEMKLKEKEIYYQKEYDELKRRNENINNIDKGQEENKISILIRDFREQKIYFPIVCSKNDKFIKIEDLLYEKYPEFKEKETYFLCNARKVNRFQTLEENRIHNSDVIYMVYDYD